MFERLRENLTGYAHRHMGWWADAEGRLREMHERREAWIERRLRTSRWRLFLRHLRARIPLWRRWYEWIYIARVKRGRTGVGARLP